MVSDATFMCLSSLGMYESNDSIILRVMLIVGFMFAYLIWPPLQCLLDATYLRVSVPLNPEPLPFPVTSSILGTNPRFVSFCSMMGKVVWGSTLIRSPYASITNHCPIVAQ